MDTIDNILYPLQVAVAWVMVSFHSLLTTLGLAPDSGLSWALSIVGLVVIMRIILIPLFVKQIKASRGMQLLAPDMQKIQKKYKGKTDPASREAMSRETMELYRKHGTNPFASCLPILAQSPIFFALFRVLYNMPRLAQEAGTENAFPRDSIGPLTRELAQEFTDATLLGGARLSQWFLGPDSTTSVKIVAAILIVAMSATTFFTQKQLTQKNMPASALQGPMAQQQKMLLYLLPLIFLITGVNFPIGVLIYWTTTNVWSMGQQFYVIRRNPTPGSAAEAALKERRARKAAARGIVLEEEEQKPAVDDKPRGQRPQPKRKHRAKGAPGSVPGGAAADAGTEPASGEASGGASTTGSTPSKAPGKRPAGAKPAGAKPAGKKPAGSRPAGAKPAGKRPASGASGDDASSGSPRTGTTPTSKAGGGRPAGTKGTRPRPSGAQAAPSESSRPQRSSGGDGDLPRKPRKPRAPRNPNA